jgi:hypothetical protein
MVALSLAIWTSLYLVVAYSRLPPNYEGKPLKRLDDLDVRNRMISFLHGSLTTVLTGYEYYFIPSSCGSPNT